MLLYYCYYLLFKTSFEHMLYSNLIIKLKVWLQQKKFLSSFVGIFGIYYVEKMRQKIKLISSYSAQPKFPLTNLLISINFNKVEPK